ncbi:hypothetical protein BZB76_5417 [Actinomadura pelletieri DSM 43383]|uniref:Uncharacterized protein n=1 Tax=Actinomadura pelletieri DSM 43383 TaxID=1120940 RepID=A0A495QG90_9ACTN|nr:hypothetical protein [Actinomadura pelletieri]RKS70937.1 hypothetical protein BZB76_5417 [Actinomadura pelletieri DSM 43383]
MTTATTSDQALPKTVEPSAVALAVPAVRVAIEAPGITLIANVDDLSEGNLCSCAAGDDNPF